MEVVKIVIDIWKDMELIKERKTEIKKKELEKRKIQQRKEEIEIEKVESYL